MSRTLATLTAAFAFSAIMATGSVVQAQSATTTQMPSQNSGSVPGSVPMQQPGSGGMSNSGGMSGATGTYGSAPQARSERSMRMERRAMRRQQRAERRAAQDPNGAYMGGGGVFERQPDGSLRPVL
ncbi:hypothetical protein [Roseomonas xinghualingensis]|uniref:hypothetical protein n=1 Tax=Roseomonas xinghualingensis TaxID=2986475 RepID=UPI0021F20AA0|nr:hypothetical protein [Roseomonas sp. SXEYE001]MCV4209069.1 hypothetical protein [Roseomonas sp. SXEYE001]